MTPITRRWFIRKTSLATSALYGFPVEAFAKAQRVLQGRETSAAAVDAAAIRKLTSEIVGHGITQEDSDYESARLVRNPAFDRHPALIVRCASSSDVARVLDFAQRQGLPVAVRGGGHSAGGTASAITAQ